MAGVLLGFALKTRPNLMGGALFKFLGHQQVQVFNNHAELGPTGGLSGAVLPKDVCPQDSTGPSTVRNLAQ